MSFLCGVGLGLLVGVPLGMYLVTRVLVWGAVLEPDVDMADLAPDRLRRLGGM